MVLEWGYSRSSLRPAQAIKKLEVKRQERNDEMDKEIIIARTLK
jgi:hypothetical protein